MTIEKKLPTCPGLFALATVLLVDAQRNDWTAF